MATVQIYISSQGKQWGPYSLKQVNFLLAKGSFRLSDWAWAQNIANWVTVAEVLRLQGQRGEQEETNPSVQQPDVVPLEAKRHIVQVKKPVAQLNVAYVAWWRKSILRNLFGVVICMLLLLLVLSWGSKDADYNMLERREGVAFEPGSSKPFDGRAVSYYPNGQLMYEALFKDGNEEGRIVSWYMNGQKQSEADMREGKFHGVVDYWYDNGQKMAHYTYKNGKVIHRKDWDPDGVAYKRK